MTFVPTKLYYKIREACDIAGVEAHVLRFWETEFPALAPPKSKSGQRTYRPKDIELILAIRKLLYEDGYTIAGARRQLGMRTSSESVKKRSSEKSTPGPGSEIEGIVFVQESRSQGDTGVSPMKNDMGERCEQVARVADTASESEASASFPNNARKPEGTLTQETLSRSIPDHELSNEPADDGDSELKSGFDFVELRELPSATPTQLSFKGAFPKSSEAPREELRGVHKEAPPTAAPLKKPSEKNDGQEKPTSDRLKRVQAELENILTLLDRE